MEKDNKVILNCLPPTSVLSPSIALTCLKTYLYENNVDSEIIYWNIIFSNINKSLELIDTPLADVQQLIPFLYLLHSDDKNNGNVSSKFISAFQNYNPQYRFKSKYYDTQLENIKTTIVNTILAYFSKYEMNKIRLIGFSSKFYQWIPAVFFSELLKKHYPNIKIVIGGFTNKTSAHAIMENHKVFDYAIWGEGEIPLLELFENTINERKLEDVSRLIYRNESELKCTTHKSDFLNLNSLSPNYDDYFQYRQIRLIVSGHESNSINIPINSIRGCSWNRCKFCVLNQGYKYQESSPEFVIKQIENCYDKYDVSTFQFVDNDTIGKDKAKFERLLDLIIDLSTRKNKLFTIFVEIIPIGLDSSIVKKMHLAGINVQIGFEALTDELLRKMNKKARFADSIFFMKFAIKYGIRIAGANIIRGIPTEKEEDVIESTKNLHFLRFFIGKSKLKLNQSELSIFDGSVFFKELGNEILTYNSNPVYKFIPENYINNENRFSCFEFSNDTLPNAKLWKSFEIIYEFLTNSHIHYQLSKYNDSYKYIEYDGDNVVNSINFENNIHWQILELANEKVCDYNYLTNNLLSRNKHLTDPEIKNSLQELKDEYLLYFDDNYNTIISIIDTNCVV